MMELECATAKFLIGRIRALLDSGVVLDAELDAIIYASNNSLREWTKKLIHIYKVSDNGGNRIWMAMVMEVIEEWVSVIEYAEYISATRSALA
jgi:hypothetical protein